MNLLFAQRDLLTTEPNVSDYSFVRRARAGYFYSDHYAVAETDDGFELDFAPTPFLRLAGFSLVTGLVCASIVRASYLAHNDPIPVTIAALCTVVTLSPFYFPLARRAVLARSRPFIAFDRAQNAVLLDGGHVRISTVNILAVADATFTDDESDAVSELQMVHRVNGDISYTFIVAMLAGAECELRHLAQGIAHAISCPHVTFDERDPKAEILGKL